MIDIEEMMTIDFRDDAGKTRSGKQRDPDIHSKKLRECHRLLWSKDVGNGKRIDLNENLIDIHSGIRFSSDSITASFSQWKNKPECVDLANPNVKEAYDTYWSIGYTIGDFAIFPANRVNMKPTINGMRGMSRQIKDRIDYTLECIRRYYHEPNSINPLKETFDRYKDFFDIFGDFKTYVDFFFFNDIVSSDCTKVLMFNQFEEFGLTNPVMDSKEEYASYLQGQARFISKRTKRIKEYLICLQQ